MSINALVKQRHILLFLFVCFFMFLMFLLILVLVQNSVCQSLEFNFLSGFRFTKTLYWHLYNIFQIPFHEQQFVIDIVQLIISHAILSVCLNIFGILSICWRILEGTEIDGNNHAKYMNLFAPNGPFPYSLKSSENRKK